MLGIRAVNLGQYLTGGDAVVPLQSLNPIYVNFGVPQQDVGQIRLGRAVRITVARSWQHRVRRPDQRHRFGRGRNDAQRQVQATLANPAESFVPACSCRHR